MIKTEFKGVVTKEVVIDNITKFTCTDCLGKNNNFLDKESNSLIFRHCDTCNNKGWLDWTERMVGVKELTPMEKITQHERLHQTYKNVDFNSRTSFMMREIEASQKRDEAWKLGIMVVGGLACAVLTLWVLLASSMR